MTTQVITVGKQGPAGPPGAAGGGSYTHNQILAATIWTIAHNLGYKPSITIYTTGGLVVEGAEQHLSNNTLMISFSSAVAGFAYLV